MIKKLQVTMTEVSTYSNHSGYQYNVQDVLVVMSLGLLCGLQTIESIFYWSKVAHIQNFLKHKFSIVRFPQKTQFYKMLTLGAVSKKLL